MRTIVVFLFFISKVLSQNCTFDVSDPQTPLIVNEDFTLPTYDENTSISFGGDVLFYILCAPGTRSPYIIETGDHVACKNNTNILNIRSTETIDFNDIKCKSYQGATVKKSDQCATNGTIYEIGFDVYNKFVSVFKVCFDEVKLTPIYCKYDNSYSAKFAKLQIDAGSDYYESYVCNGTACDWVDSGNVYHDIDMDGIYDNQEEILQNLGVGNVSTSLLRFPLSASKLVSNRNDRQRMQNIPYYDYINVVPTWDFEMLDVLIYLYVASVPSDVGSTFCTGTLGVLTLPSNNGDQVEVYLINGHNGHQIPVPKWIWTVLDITEQIIFYYNYTDSTDGSTEINQICSDHIFLSPGIYSCEFETVIEPEMRKLINNGFN